MPPCVRFATTHSPKHGQSQKDWVLQIFGEQSCHHDGEGHLLNLNSHVDEEETEQLQRPRHDVDVLLVHQGTVAIADGKADESHHHNINWKKKNDIQTKKIKSVEKIYIYCILNAEKNVNKNNNLVCRKCLAAVTISSTASVLHFCSYLKPCSSVPAELS